MEFNQEAQEEAKKRFLDMVGGDALPEAIKQKSFYELLRALERVAPGNRSALSPTASFLYLVI